MSMIILVVHLMSVSEMNIKWLPVFELLCVLHPTAIYEIYYFPCALYLIECHPTRHYLHHIIRLFQSKYFKYISSSVLVSIIITSLTSV